MSRFVAALVYARKTGSAMRKSILAYMAERANDDGSGIWCSKQRIADEIEASRGSVISNIADMVADGLLIEVGKRQHQNGWTMEYAINLQAVSDLPKAQADDPFKIERVEGGPVQPLNATRSTVERQDVQPLNTNRPLTVLEPSPYVGKIWEITPKASKARSSQKLLKVSLAPLLKKHSGEDLIDAFRKYLSVPDTARDDFKFVPAVHRWFSQGRFEQYLPRGASLDLVPEKSAPAISYKRWAGEIEYYIETSGNWTGDGPAPHEDGCRAPVDLLEKAQYTADMVRKARRMKA